MSFNAILLLAIGLAMDATAVSAARGLAVPRVRARHVLLIGWLLGERLGPLVHAWDHWIACGLLAAIGGKMLREARANE